MPAPVFLVIEPDQRAPGDQDVAIDNRSMDARVPAENVLGEGWERPKNLG